MVCRKWRAICCPGRAACTDHWGMFVIGVDVGLSSERSHHNLPVTGLAWVKPAQLVLWDAYPSESSEWP